MASLNDEARHGLNIFDSRPQERFFMRYVVQVQLERVRDQSPSYNDLHRHMKKAGFKKSIKARDGGIKRAPQGMYLMSAENTDIAKVMRQAKRAATEYWENPRIVVIEVSRLLTDDLKAVSIAAKLDWSANPMAED